MPASNILFELQGIDKRFGGVHALNNVSLAVEKGEVHAIVGENGAGKSTLMKIMVGTYQPDQGKMFVDGQETSFNNSHDAHAAGINIIYQEFFAFSQLSVVANVFAGKEVISHGFLNEKEMRIRACDVFNRIGVKMDLDATVGDLSIAEQQMIEIAKALVYEGRLVIMDEPNSALTDRETQSLFQMIQRLKEEGITVLYISHRLEEVFQICDRITVLRDGKLIGTWNKEEVNIPFIISKMIGRTLGEAFPEMVEHATQGKPILSVSGLTKQDRLKDINFEVWPGEVLGFAGLEGCGIRDLFHILFGIDQKDEGEIYYQGKVHQISFTKAAIKNGWGMIPANRRDHGLIMRWPIKDNISLVILERLLGYFGLVNDRKVDETSVRYINKLRISTDSPDKTVFDLSGGNQQKVVISKWLATNPKILVLDDPTRGIDVGAKSEIYQLIQDLAKQGLAILFNSSEIDEVLGLSHRVLVMRQGAIVKEFTHKEADKTNVLRYVSGDINHVPIADFEEQKCD